MKVKDFIKVLEKLPKNADINYGNVFYSNKEQKNSAGLFLYDMFEE